MSRKKALLIGLSVLLLVGLVALAVWAVTYNKNSTTDEDKKTSAYVCSNELITEATNTLEKYDGRKYQELEDKVKKINGNDKDPNCQYILARLYLSSGRAAPAEEAIRKQKEALDNGLKISAYFRGYDMSIEDQTKVVESIKSQDNSDEMYIQPGTIPELEGEQ